MTIVLQTRPCRFGGFILTFDFPSYLKIFDSNWLSYSRDGQTVWIRESGSAWSKQGMPHFKDRLNGFQMSYMEVSQKAGYPVPLSHPFWSLISTKNQAFWASFNHILGDDDCGCCDLAGFSLVCRTRGLREPQGLWQAHPTGGSWGSWGLGDQKKGPRRGGGASISESSKVGDLKTLAQKPFGHGFSRLVTAEASILRDPMQTLQAAGLEDDDQLTANVGELKLWGWWSCYLGPFGGDSWQLCSPRSAEECASKFGQQIEHLLQSWNTALLLPGAIHVLVVIAQPCKIS